MTEMLPAEQETLGSDKNYKGQLVLFSIFGERDNVQLDAYGQFIRK